jgi:DNA-binding NarL/FixJ family response regulator
VRLITADEALLAPSITRRLIESYVRRPQIGADVRAEIATLTERETEVLRLVARGLNNREISETIFVSEATVKTHINRLLAKLHLRDRVQAVVRAYEWGLVTPGDAAF